MSEIGWSELPAGAPRSHRPRSVRQPTWVPALAERVLSLRQQYPRWGKDKLVVERSHRSHNEEFYEVLADSDQLPALNRQLRRWEKTYNCVRPHQSLAYLTPLEFLTRWKANPRKAKCH